MLVFVYFLSQLLLLFNVKFQLGYLDRERERERGERNAFKKKRYLSRVGKEPEETIELSYSVRVYLFSVSKALKPYSRYVLTKIDDGRKRAFILSYYSFWKVISCSNYYLLLIC